ncbi:MAG TPA: hypothetical protein VMB03_23740 [Bryobacteraceae bacterium]|nr:hypothetical protein [Bryobacteraceae bacterium]
MRTKLNREPVPAPIDHPSGNRVELTKMPASSPWAGYFRRQPYLIFEVEFKNYRHFEAATGIPFTE